MKKGKLTLALTGSFGSGKSTVLSMFKRLGAQTVDCDRIGRELTSGCDSRLNKLLIKSFGPRATLEGGKMNRREMAKLVFRNPKARKKLERILHPRIMNIVRQTLAASATPVRVVEIPLLFESGMENLYDASIVVRAPMSLISRRLARRGWSAVEIKNRLNSQMSLNEKCKKADFILDNKGTPRDLYKQTKMLYKACLTIIEGESRNVTKRRTQSSGGNHE